MKYVVYFGNWDVYDIEKEFNSMEEAEAYVEENEDMLAPEEYYEIEIEER